MDDELRDFLRHSLRSVWNIELLLWLYRHPSRGWYAADLVQEMRASDLIVSQGLATLQQAGLIAVEARGACHYSPASPELDRLMQRLDRIYRERPAVVTRALFSLSGTSL
jgi:diadenosine tetraphosphatase ApaH/serine/threonine PP2A family protein phosphatase